MILKNASSMLEIDALSFTHSPTTDTSDSQWIKSEIKITVPGFKAHFGVDLYYPLLKKLSDDLSAMCAMKSRKVVFRSVEEILELSFSLNDRGNINCDISARYEESTLLCCISTDIITIEYFLKELKKELDIFNPEKR